MALQTKHRLRSEATDDDAEHFEPMSYAIDVSLRQIDRIARLEQDWDSYGADPPSTTSIEAAARLAARAITAHFKAVGEQARPWAIAPFSGGVQLEWRGPSKTLEVQVDHHGSFGYLLVEGTEPQAQYQEGDDVSIDVALALVASLFTS